MRHQLVVSSLILGLAGATAADDSCGTRLLPEHLPKALAQQAAGMYELPPAAVMQTYTVPLTIHVVRRSDGTGGASQAQVAQTIADANAIWEQAEIEFCQYGPIRYIDNDFYYLEVNTSFEQGLLRSIDQVENTINVYFIENFPWCGSGSFTFMTLQGIILANDCAGVDDNTTSFAHELGHYLDLFHTHETFFGVECVDGSNCDAAGDLLCDTPADPELNRFIVNTSCAMTVSISGPCPDDGYYEPDTENLMSYSRKLCRLDMSQEQIDRARATLLNLRPELLAMSCDLDAPCGGDAGDCYASNGSPGCADPACCARVCATDPYCCDTTWDSLCADEAIDMCRSGNECDTAIAVGEGEIINVTLFDNTGATGDDTSCGSADDLDEWYAFTPDCTGMASAEVCTELTVVDITLAVYDHCAGSELVCSENHTDCPWGNDANALVTWLATAGETYYIRVSGESATPGENFTGNLYLRCPEGCGSVFAGDCFEDNDTAYCDDEACCRVICEADPFCCDNEWDQLCANAAITTCVYECGSPVTEDCFTEHLSAACEREDCCDAVCADDSFCCDFYWDSLCVDGAIEFCSEPYGDAPHIPLGGADLLPEGNTLQVLNVVDPGDGVGVILGSLGDPRYALLDITTPPFQAGRSIRIGACTDTSPLPAMYDGALEAVHDGQGIELYPTWLGMQSYTLQVWHGPTLVFQALNSTGPAAALSDPATIDALVARITRQGELELRLVLHEAVTVDVGGPVVLGDAVAVISEQITGPDDPLEDRLLTRVDVTGNDLGWFVITGEDFTDCPADTNADGVVDVQDLIQVILAWGPCVGCGADVNEDDAVDVQDLIEVILSWGACP